jgi:hypothetical protein
MHRCLLLWNNKNEGFTMKTENKPPGCNSIASTTCAKYYAKISFFGTTALAA